MSKSQKKRLCWNCEGSISFQEEVCPFCGVSVVPAFLEGTEANFAPPYSMNSEKDFGIPRSPYDTSDDKTHSEADDSSIKDENDPEPTLDEFKRTVLAVVLLLSGSVFFLFGLALALFSQNGIFTLHWNGNIWFAYTLLALPLLFIGWRSLMKLE